MSAPIAIAQAICILHKACECITWQMVLDQHCTLDPYRRFSHLDAVWNFTKELVKALEQFTQARAPPEHP